jgi:hypothetical protein
MVDSSPNQMVPESCINVIYKCISSFFHSSFTSRLLFSIHALRTEARVSSLCFSEEKSQLSLPLTIITSKRKSFCQGFVHFFLFGSFCSKKLLISECLSLTDA